MQGRQLAVGYDFPTQCSGIALKINSRLPGRPLVEGGQNRRGVHDSRPSDTRGNGETVLVSVATRRGTAPDADGNSKETRRESHVRNARPKLVDRANLHGCGRPSAEAGGLRLVDPVRVLRPSPCEIGGVPLRICPQLPCDENLNVPFPLVV